MEQIELKERLTKTSLSLNRYYKNFNPFACGGKFKKAGVPIETICQVMDILNNRKPSKPWGYAINTLKELRVQENIIASLTAHENHKKAPVPTLIKNIFKDMAGF